MTEVFERRLRRAETLAEMWPFAAEILRTYACVAAFQRDVSREGQKAVEERESGALSPLLLGHLERLVGRVASEGPPALAEEASRWKGSVGERFAQEAARPGDPTPPDAGALYAFLRRALGQLPAGSGRPGDPAPRSPEASDVCPTCGRRPLAAILREDPQAQAVRRTLLCPGGLEEWDFPRVLCPTCREERPEKLPRYHAQEIPWIRIEACDSCRGYLKAIDLSKCPEAEPLVDELASTPLDLIAQERGYTKLSVNLAGL